MYYVNSNAKVDSFCYGMNTAVYTVLTGLSKVHGFNLTHSLLPGTKQFAISDIT